MAVVEFNQSLISDAQFKQYLTNAKGTESGTINIAVGCDEQATLTIGPATVNVYVTRTADQDKIVFVPTGANKFDLRMPAFLKHSHDQPLIQGTSVYPTNLVFAYADFDNDKDIDLIVSATGMVGGILFTQIPISSTKPEPTPASIAPELR